MRGFLRKGGLAAWLLLGCSQTTTPTPTGTARPGLCLFPQACYQQACDCQSGPDTCRYLSGTADAGGSSLPTDPAADCPAQAGNGQALTCTTPEALCVARGVACSGFCVRRGQSCADPGPSGPIAPQHRGGDGGSGTYCPFGNDTCCPGPAPSDGGLGDGSVPADMSLSDH